MKSQHAILITGANGFVGSAVTSYLKSTGGYTVSVAVRALIDGISCPQTVVGEINGATDWAQAVSSQNVVIHLAARVNVTRADVADPYAEYSEVNVKGTMNLARQAADSGVKRFIFVSSIKVNGEATNPNRPFLADDRVNPVEPYGVSKWEAELGLQEIGRDTGMEIVIIRPPLVYGPGVKGNFADLIKLVGCGFPLPLGGVKNKRSLIALDNLVDLVATCINHPNAVNQVFLASDGRDLSTAELLKCIADAMGKPSRLLNLPVSLVAFFAVVIGRKSHAARLLGSLQIDISKTRDLLNWKPPVSVELGVRRCIESIESKF